MAVSKNGLTRFSQHSKGKSHRENENLSP